MTAQAPYILFGDIVEENGKTIRQNNMDIKHNIPVGALVEAKCDRWHGDGACEITHARWWVAECGRDCDGTPLYWLCPRRETVKHDEDGEPTGEGFDEMLLLGVCGSFDAKPDRKYWKYLDLMTRVLHEWRGGFPEESLTVIEVTEELKKGHGSLQWSEDGA